jgi:hypothetical protein
MNQDLEIGIQKLKDWAEKLDFRNGQLSEIIKLFEQAKKSQEEKDKKAGELLIIEAEKITHRELHIVKYDPTTRPDLWEEIKEDFKTKKYKLVKTYPGSPKLGTIVYKTKLSYNPNLTTNTDLKKGNSLIGYFDLNKNFEIRYSIMDMYKILIPIEEVENQLEFWQKIIENDTK